MQMYGNFGEFPQQTSDLKFGLVIHQDPCIIEKNPYDPGTLGCIPNSVPIVSIVLSRYSWEIITHKNPT